MQNALSQCRNIRYSLEATCTALLGDDALSGLLVKNVKTGSEETLRVTGVFVAIGINPRTELVKGQIELASDGSIITDTHMHTRVPGIYAAGDVRNTPLRQVITACADGALAATEAVAFLSS